MKTFLGLTWVKSKPYAPDSEVALVPFGAQVRVYTDFSIAIKLFKPGTDSSGELKLSSIRRNKLQVEVPTHTQASTG